MADTSADRHRLVAAARAYHDHRERYGHLPATDEPHPTFDEFMLALIEAFPEGGWNKVAGIARLIVLVAGDE